MFTTLVFNKDELKDSLLVKVLVLKQRSILDLWGIAEHQQLPVYIEHDGAGLKTNQCKSLITGTNCVALWNITHPGYKLYGYKKQIIISWWGEKDLSYLSLHHRKCQQNKLIWLLVFTLPQGLAKSCKFYSTSTIQHTMTSRHCNKA